MSAQDVFASSTADDTRSQGEVLFKLVWILLTQTQKRMFFDALKCPVGHGLTEGSGHLGGQWAGLLTRLVYLSVTWPKVMEENFLCMSSISSEPPPPSHRKDSLTLLGHRGHF